MNEDPIKKAMLKYAPALAGDYKEFVKNTFHDIKEALGDNLQGVYSHPRWVHLFYNIRNSLTQEGTGIRHGPYQYKWKIDSSKLAKNAKDYGERVALEWHMKMWEKLGLLDDVTVTEPDPAGFIVVMGRHKNNKVKIIQERILNVSKLGTPFHQFPARIYVNDQFKSEYDYKKIIRGWNVKVIEREKKPKRPPIDPMSRPREFHFEFKLDRPAQPPHRPKPVIGELDKDYAKGMTQEEAWHKIYRRMMGYGYYTRVYDPKVIRIWAWNGVLLWKAGMPAGPPPIKVVQPVKKKPAKAKRQAGRKSSPSLSVSRRAR